MRAFSTDLVHVFLSLPFYVVCLLGALSCVALRDGAAAGLRRWRYGLVATALLAYAASAEVVGNTLAGKFEGRYPVPLVKQEPSPAATVLILTAGTPRLTAQGYRATVTADGIQRVIAGVDLWRRTGAKLLFSGAPVPDLSDSMAHEMARLAVGMGVPREAILIEARSTNTYENLVFSQRLLEEAGRAGGPLIMVVSAFQMPRAAAVARKLGMPVLPFPCDFRAAPHPGWQYWIPSNDGAQAFEEVMHELIGLAAYRVRGWI